MPKHLIADIPQKAIIMNEKGEILIVQDKESGVWELPGGRLHEDEDPKEGLKREIKEELSMDISIKKIFDTFVFKGVSDTSHFVVVYFCEPVGDLDKMKIQEKEIMDIKWISPEQLGELSMRGEYKNLLDKFFKYKNEK